MRIRAATGPSAVLSPDGPEIGWRLGARRVLRLLPVPSLPASHLPTWPAAGGSLALGFAVAELTGVRPIGGIVLFLGALWCGLRWRRARGLPIALGLVAVFLLCFVLSHRLGDLIGTWPSVFVVSAISALAAWLVVDRRGQPGPPTGDGEQADGPSDDDARPGRLRRLLRPKPLTALVLVGFAALFGGRMLLLGAAAGTPDATASEVKDDGAQAKRVGLVLGAGLRPDGSPTLLLRDRIRAGVKLLEQGKVSVLLMSGDNSVKGYNEPSAMRRAAIDAGADPGRVAVDYGGRRTWDSCARAERVFGVTHAIVVSNDFHRARTVVLCEQAGITVDGAVGTSTSGFPVHARAKWQLRELVASWRGAGDAWIREPNVAVGGEPIDIFEPCGIYASLAPEDRAAWTGPGCEGSPAS